MGCKPGIGIRMVRALAVLLSVLACSNHSIGATAWVGGPFMVTMTTPITQVGQSFSGSSLLPLAHDTPCTVSVSASNGSEVLKSAGGSTLSTQYMLTGVPGGDGGWVDSTTFLSHTYAVPGNNITTNLTLWVQGTAPADRAPEAGAYTATITITVAF
jgi:hypothetical protein